MSDYTYLLAQALVQAGDEVHVWAPCSAESSVATAEVVVHRMAGNFGFADLARMGQEIDSWSPNRILVQYVPHAFGWKAMNLPFCFWLSRRHIPVWVMFHEVVFPLHWLQRPSHQLLGVITRLMALLTVRSSERVFVSTPAWSKFVRQLGGTRVSPVWLPVPSNIHTAVDAQRVAALRQELTGTGSVTIGHFGTYSQALCPMLQTMVTDLLAADPCRYFLLLGRNSQALVAQILAAAPALAKRIIAPGGLSAEELSLHLAVCDVVVQPYPDGITTRRGSSMAPLALGIPVVTNFGVLSESLWRESGAVVLAESYSSRAFVETTEELLGCRERVASLRARAISLYSSRFSMQCTLQAIKGSV